MQKITSQNHINKLKNIVGKNCWVDKQEEMQPYLKDQRDSYHNKTPIILMPDSTLKISKIAAYCSKNKIQLVPQGGNTGLVGGSAIGIDNNEILINLSKMNKVRKILKDDSSIIVEAGIKLYQIQELALANSKLFPLSLSILRITTKL